MGERAVTRAETGRVLLLDGPSGSGKTTIARGLSQRLGARCLHVEHFYPGWDGLAAGAAWLVESVLAPWSRGETVRLREWDWHAGGFRDGGALEPGGDLVVEGCGAISRASVPFAVLAAWIEADEPLRRERATRRDGDAAWWPGWREQEREFFDRERSRELADLILDGTSTGTAGASLEAALATLGWRAAVERGSMAPDAVAPER